MLPLWRPIGPVTDAEHAAWCEAGHSIALGIELVAHLEPILAVDELQVGFCCDSEELAELFVERIRMENVDAERCRAHPGGISQYQTCDVALPCSPQTTHEQIDHAVLAAVKASHGIMCPRMISREFLPSAR